MKALILSELRQRVRGRRWWILLGTWTVVLFLLTWLVRNGVQQQLRFSPDPNLRVGAITFGSLALFVLGLACLVLPSITATSINGERDRGTFAVLQATLMTPWQIYGAKFAAAMITSAAFLAATLPITLWCFTAGGLDVGRVAAVYLILVVISGVVIALALAASGLVRRAGLSAVLAYGAVFALTIGSLILFGLAMLTAQRDPETFVQAPGWRWVLLAPNPFVVLADAAPRTEARRIDDPLSAIRDGVRGIRQPQPFVDYVLVPGEPPPPPPEPPPVWPTGVAIELAIAAGAAYVTVRRITLPARRLAPGERVA